MGPSVNAIQLDLQVIEGIVCSKSVTHGSMPRYIQNAAVMALAGSVEYERVPGKLSSIDAIIAQVFI